MSALAMKAYARARSSAIAEPLSVPEHRELGDVPPEEERRRPVGHDAELPGEEGQLVEVVRPRDEPAEEARQPHSEDIGDALVAAEGRYLAEHPVAVRLGLVREVLREPPCLAQGVLARRRVDLARRRLVRHGGTVAERPHVLETLYAHRPV